MFGPILKTFNIKNEMCFLPDQDGDKKLTLSEFISLPVGTVENQQAQDIDDDWVRERRKEFEEVIDSDRNGIVTMEELEVRRRFLVLSDRTSPVVLIPLLRSSGVHGPDERAQRSERGQADDRRGG